MKNAVIDNKKVSPSSNGNGQVQGLTVSKAPGAVLDPDKKVLTVPVVANGSKPIAEPTKSELKADFTAKGVMNLDATLKLVEELHRKKVSRDRLLTTIDTLEKFEVQQEEEQDGTGAEKFQNCELTIEDDQRNQFKTKNPFIVKKVAEYINALCIEKLAEIEGGIQIPA